MNKRLFLAINLPLNIKNELADLVVKLHQDNKNKTIKWVEENNFHLTLHFLGDTTEEKIKQINQALQPITEKFNPLNYQLANKISAFPNLQEPKVIFLEMKELNNGQTFELHKQIGEGLESLGFTIDKRPFRLHLTLGRVKFKTSLQIPDFVLKVTNFSVNSIDLMASQLSPTGPKYTKITTFNLTK